MKTIKRPEYFRHIVNGRARQISGEDGVRQFAELPNFCVGDDAMMTPHYFSSMRQQNRCLNADMVVKKNSPFALIALKRQEKR